MDDRTARIWAWACFGSLLVTGAASAAVALADSRSYSDWGGGDAVSGIGFTVVIMLFPAVGMLIVHRQPRNRIGWLLLATGVAWAVSGVTDIYTRIALSLSPGSLPAGGAVEVLGGTTWVPPLLLMGVFLVLLFPDGRLPGPRWRPLAWIAVVDAVLIMLAITFAPTPVDDVLVPLPSNPLGFGSAAFWHAVVVVTLPIFPACILAAAVSAVVRFRRASGVQRLQMKWLMAAVSLIASLYTLAMLVSLLDLARTSTGGENGFMLTLQNVAVLSFGLIPVVIGIAITRHGLYGIDRLISRTLLVGLLGLFVTAVYVGVVVGVGTAIGQRHPSVWLSVLATALVAVAFQPVRERLRRLVNRLVYGDRATPYEVLSDFAGQMAGRYTTGELLPRIARTVSECLGGAKVGVWLRTGDRLAREAVWPAPAPGVESVEVRGEELPALPADHVSPVRHGAELLGALAVDVAGREPLSPGERSLLQHVASQAGLVLRNVRLVEELQASRERLVSAADDQRRRLERNLHDGAQQSLVSVALMLRMAETKQDPEVLSRTLHEAADQLQLAIGELRELARGIHPAVLTDRGLAPALTSLAERCPIPVHLHDEVGRRLPRPVEGTLYFVTAEALTNVAKYAFAQQVEVRLTDLGTEVHLDIRDDGVGGADRSRGSGLLGLTDRVAVHEGDLTVLSPVGEGTRITCRLPVPAPAVSDDRPLARPTAAMAR